MASYTDNDLEQRLAAVRAAIDRCLYAQRYNIGDRRKDMPDLAALFEMERELAAELAYRQGRMATVVQIDKPGAVP